MSHSWKDYVYHRFSGNCSDVRFIYGDSHNRSNDSRDHHITNDLLVYDTKESSGVFQGYDASMDNGVRYSFKVNLSIYL